MRPGFKRNNGRRSRSSARAPIKFRFSKTTDIIKSHSSPSTNENESTSPACKSDGHDALLENTKSTRYATNEYPDIEDKPIVPENEIVTELEELQKIQEISEISVESEPQPSPKMIAPFSRFVVGTSASAPVTSLLSNDIKTHQRIANIQSNDELSKSPFALLCYMTVISTGQLKLCCQLAHGSPTAIISNFNSLEELFKSIADCFDISPDDIIFCTINSFKPDMNKLFSGSLEYTDMLFAHVKGQPVEVKMTKTESVFGLTVSDNGRCRSFIKRIKENSIAANAQPALAVGQLIEKIDDLNVTGMRHFEVVRVLRNMPLGKTFTIRLVSPLQSGFSLLAPRSFSQKRVMESGTQTLRFKAEGGIVIQEGSLDRKIIGCLNEIFDSYLGVQDDQLAQSIWDMALSCHTLHEMSKTIKESELKMFDFPEELIFDMWGLVKDWRRKVEANDME